MSELTSPPHSPQSNTATDSADPAPQTPILATGNPTIPETIHVVLVDDNGDDAFLTEQMLHDIPDQHYEVEWVAKYDEAMARLKKLDYDIALIDYRLGGVQHNGLKLLKSVFTGSLCRPAILLTGIDDRRVDIAAAQAGVSDYLIKDNLSGQLMERSIRYSLSHHYMLQQVRANERRKELLLATLTHDLRTPVKAEFRILEELAHHKFGPLNDIQQEVLNELIRSNRYLSYMVDNLLSAHRFEEYQAPLHRSPVQLNTLIEEVAQSDLQWLLEEKSQTVSLDLDPSLATQSLDEMELKRVLYNLLQNAIKFSSKHSAIAVQTRQLPNGIQFTITDNGPGIDDEKKTTLFQPFSSMAKKHREVGIGLGLYVCKQIIDAHHGTITADSAPDGGTMFTVFLPAVISE